MQKKHIWKMIDIDKKVHGDIHVEVAQDIGQLASLYIEMERLEDSDSLFVHAISIIRTLSPSRLYLSTLLLGRSQVLIEQGRFSEAELLLREALAIRENAFPEGHGEIAEVLSIYGRCLFELNRPKEAIDLLSQAFDGLYQRNTEDPFRKISEETLLELHEDS